MTSSLPRPEPDEYNEFYRSYIELVPDGDIVERLAAQFEETRALLATVSEDRETYRYGEGKWSVREVVGHLTDIERVFAFRAIAMAREEGAELPGMDHDAWVASSNATDRSLPELVGEWAAVREANVRFFGSLGPAEGAQSGLANGFPVTVRTFPWLIAGHELWHRGLLERDYLGGEA